MGSVVEDNLAGCMSAAVFMAVAGALSAAWGGSDSGAGSASLTTAASVSGEAAVDEAAAAFLAGAGELVALVLGAEVRGVIFADVRGMALVAVGGLATERETGRVGGEAVGRVVRGVAPDVEAVVGAEVTDLLAERDAGRETDEAALAAVAAAGLVTERDAGLLGVASALTMAVAEAAFGGFAALLVVGRVVTEREAGREVGGAGTAVGGRGEREVRDLLAGRVVGCGRAATAGERANVGMRDGKSLLGLTVGMAAVSFVPMCQLEVKN